MVAYACEILSRVTSPAIAGSFDGSYALFPRGDIQLGLSFV